MEARIQFQARIEVALAGYEWSAGGGRSLLMDRGAPGWDGEQTEMSPETFRWYDPFRDEPALFHCFADLDALPWPLDFSDDEGVARLRVEVQEFANQYGVPSVPGEFLLTINREIQQMRVAIDLWRSGIAQDAETIAKHILWDKRQGWHTSQATLPGIRAPDSWADAPRGKRHLLQRAVELVDAIIEQKCAEDFRFKPLRHSGGVVLSVEVGELLPALWLQFAIAVAEDKQYRRCEVCGRAFELSPGANRADRRSCSDKCRVRGYRRRKAQATTMRAAGAHLREIAKQLETDMGTVKRWVGEV